MRKLKIFCTSINYYKLIDKLPSYITPLGLGKNLFPPHWLDEKKGSNITHLNTYYGELTGINWLWKNKLHEMNKNDLIGICHYRKLWLNKNYETKQKFTFSSLYSNLLDSKEILNEDFNNYQVQPIVFKNKNLLIDFEQIHRTDILTECLSFVNKEYQNSFSNHLKDNKLYPLNMFITDVNSFEKYCEEIFPWLEKCLNLCLKKNLCEGYNVRLPAFLAERFTSFWFSQHKNKKNLSYARLGKKFLSNNLNEFINPIKIPLTFRMFPTIHKY